MHIFLHADSNTDGGHRMAEHLQTVVQAGMARFAERVTRVEAHLSDVNSLAKSSDADIHCTLEARLVGTMPSWSKTTRAMPIRPLKARCTSSSVQSQRRLQGTTPEAASRARRLQPAMTTRTGQADPAGRASNGRCAPGCRLQTSVAQLHW